MVVNLSTNITVRLSRPSGLHHCIFLSLAGFFALRPAPCALLPATYYLLQPSATHLADDIAPLGLCCKNITIACLFLYSTYYLLQLRTWLMISPRWGCAAKT
ncbi:MAG: hypothetical protein RBR47_14295 [Bacteroidales bacterium]|nr:hypothetical protein [Bacteroidales bacterium]MDD3527032.1 hypothetical protein [Bacteroidales bacterium]MDD4178313.1 hypothetical protein [Bacteroidales bacterium]MDY0336120.1 hypothetical protein [Bacteroidales bacterium]